MFRQQFLLFGNHYFHYMPTHLPLFAISLVDVLLMFLLQILGLTAVVMVGIWIGKNGFAWNENPELEFSYHPLFMIIGMVFLYGNGTIF